MSEQYSPTGFKLLPTVVKNLLIINALFFLATLSLARFQVNGQSIDLTNYLGLHFFLSKNFMPYQLVTYMFMHANFEHLFFNMFALWMFGNTLENIWGAKRFLLFYMVCGIGAGLCQELVQYIQLRSYHVDDETMAVVINNGADLIKSGLNWEGTLGKVNAIVNFPTVGASGAIYGLLLAFGMIFPNAMIYIYFLIPLKAKWFVIIYAAIELFSGLATTGDNVAHFAHLGGMLFGLLLILHWKKKMEIY